MDCKVFGRNINPNKIIPTKAVEIIQISMYLSLDFSTNTNPTIKNTRIDIT